MTDVPLTLPDRQTVYMLQYLTDALNADRFLAAEKPDSIKAVVAAVLARWPVRKQDKRLVIEAASLPLMALYSDAGTAADLSVNTLGGSDTYHLEYIFRIPQYGRDYDGMAIALAWVKKVAWRAVKSLRAHTSLAMCEQAGIRGIKPGKWTVAWYPNEGVLLHDWTIVVDHLESSSTPEELQDLKEIAVTLNLYDQTDTDTGLDVEATFDPGSPP